MARKRASMREGPLAELFRSTGPEPAEVEAHANGAAEIEAAPTRKPRKARKRDGGGGGARSAEVERAGEPIEVPEFAELEAELDEMEALVTEEIEEAAEVEEESAPPAPAERLRNLIGEEAAREKPAFGRDAPDPARHPSAARTQPAVLRVVGVGGAGVNAVNRMVDAGVQGPEFLAVNTDLQSLQISKADATLHIGAELTRGLGSGADPRVGYRAAFDEQEKLKGLLRGSDMVFVTAGAGGGTGTGAAPMVAKLAREVGALTVAVVTKPFTFEGAKRMAQAEEGIAALGSEVDTLIVVPNERLLTVLERRTSIVDAFRVADDVLRQAVQGISDLVMLPGVINLDFADVRTTMLDAGDAILGIGMGSGEHRAVHAAEKAVSSPLLDSSVEGARSLLLSVTGGPNLSLIEASEAARVVQEAAHPEAEIIFGASVDEELTEQVWVTVIATRFDSEYAHRYRRERRAEERTKPRRRPAGYGSGVAADLRTLEVPEFIPGH